MGGGVNDWFGVVMVSGGAYDLSWMSFAVGEGGDRLDAGISSDFLVICTGLASTASRSGVITSLTDLVVNALVNS